MKLLSMTLRRNLVALDLLRGYMFTFEKNVNYRSAL